MTLFGNRVLADVIIKIRSYWIRVDPKSNNRCPSRNRRVDTGKHLKEGHVRMKAETGVMQL